jgi:predicted AAA+ superfamily ATPase
MLIIMIIIDRTIDFHKKKAVMITRVLDLADLLKKSLFLFGPRVTGKSSLIKQQFQEKALILNLLDTQFFFASQWCTL